MDGRWRRAHGAGPERGNAEPKRGAGRWGKTFWFLLWRLTKGTRRKGETISGRYRRNGYVHPKKMVRHDAAIAGKPAPTGKQVESREGRFPIMKPVFPPLPQRHTRLPSTKWKISPNPPQVEGLDYRHSTNRANTPGNSISANPQANSPVFDCPFDCHHRIANTHGNLMLPARNKE